VSEKTQSTDVHAHTSHSHEIQPNYIKFDGLLNADKVEIFMGVLHWEDESIELMRCKGLYYARNSEDQICQFILQGVDDTFEWRLLKTYSESETPTGKLFIQLCSYQCRFQQ